jgi:hypothetical protein
MNITELMQGERTSANYKSSDDLYKELADENLCQIDIDEKRKFLSARRKEDTKLQKLHTWELTHVCKECNRVTNPMHQCVNPRCTNYGVTLNSFRVTSFTNNANANKPVKNTGFKFKGF